MELAGTQQRRALRIAGFVVLAGAVLAGTLFGLGPEPTLRAPLTLLCAALAAAVTIVIALALPSRPTAPPAYGAGNDNHLEPGST